MPESTLKSILKMRCPRCRRGQVFSGWFRMHKKCPECGLIFEPEPGYFLGSMYISYALGGILVIGMVLALASLTQWSLSRIFGLAALVLWLCTSLVFRYSRILYMYLERNTFKD